MANSTSVMVRLENMNDSDYDEYVKSGVKNYADENVKSGAWTPEEAMEKATEQFKGFLPKGKNTENNYFFNIVDEATSKKIGILWYAYFPRGNERSGGFIFDIIVYDEFRGKGLGKETMLALEEKAREMGHEKIGLHVFAHNKVAVNLYEKVGYKVTDLMMYKDL